MRKKILAQIVKERPQAGLVKNKYRTLAIMVKRMFPNDYEKIPYEVWEKIIFEVVNGDRDWRLITKDSEQPLKKVLSQEWIIKNLI